METARPAPKASPVRVIYNATSNTFDPRRWRRQIRSTRAKGKQE